MSFDFAVGLRETAVLPLMFCPRIYEKTLHIDVWSLHIRKNAPLGCPIAATNAFIPVDLMQKIVRLSRVDYILNRDENGPIIRIRFLKYGWSQPMIPSAVLPPATLP